MKLCSQCASSNPDMARYCMACGAALPAEPVPEPKPAIAGFGVFGLTVLGSLLLSAVLMFVFHLPVFLLFGFLPLLWWRRKD